MVLLSPTDPNNVDIIATNTPTAVNNNGGTKLSLFDAVSKSSRKIQANV